MGMPDARPPLRWVPIGLGLVIAVLLIVVQMTRSTQSAERAKTPLPSAKTAKETPAGSPSQRANRTE